MLWLRRGCCPLRLRLRLRMILGPCLLRRRRRTLLMNFRRRRLWSCLRLIGPASELRLRLRRRRRLRLRRSLSPPELRLHWLWLRRLRLCLWTSRLRPTPERSLTLLRLIRSCGLRLRRSLSPTELRLRRLRLRWLWLCRLRLCLWTSRLRSTPERGLALLRLRLTRSRGLRLCRSLSPPELRLSWLWLPGLRLPWGRAASGPRWNCGCPGCGCGWPRWNCGCPCGSDLPPCAPGTVRPCGRTAPCGCGCAPFRWKPAPGCCPPRAGIATRGSSAGSLWSKATGRASAVTAGRPRFWL